MMNRTSVEDGEKSIDIPGREKEIYKNTQT
jgi:hypothetical protein